MKVAVYEQPVEPQEQARKHAELLRFLEEQKKWQADWYQDDYQGEEIKHLPGIHQLGNRIKYGKYKKVVVSSLADFGLHSVALHKLLKEWAGHGCSLVSVRESFDTAED